MANLRSVRSSFEPRPPAQIPDQSSTSLPVIDYIRPTNRMCVSLASRNRKINQSCSNPRHADWRLRNAALYPVPELSIIAPEGWRRIVRLSSRSRLSANGHRNVVTGYRARGKFDRYGHAELSRPVLTRRVSLPDRTRRRQPTTATE